jgi:putative ABC transport system permease protein
MAEGLLLGVAGVVTGNVVSLVIIHAIRLMKMTFAFGMKEGFILAPSMSVLDVLYVSGIVIVVSILGSMQPAWRASRLEPIKALRSV